MRHWRVSTWLLIAWTVLMLIWLITGVNAGHCSDQTGSFQHAKQSGCEAGTAIGATIIVVIWFLGYIPLGIVWFARRGRRPTPGPTQPPAGWYPDPWRQSAQRWWDGSQWTQHVA